MRISAAEIAEDDARLLRQQQEFRRAADVVTTALMRFEEVERVALIGSVARPLWREVPRFGAYRRAGVELWHECKDLDLAVWVTSQARLGALRRAKAKSLQATFVAGHQVELFLVEPGTDRYLGRVCSFNECPKHKPPCLMPGCGAIPFNRRIEDFRPLPDLLAPAAYATLYRRGEGRLCSAIDLAGPMDATP